MIKSDKIEKVALILNIFIVILSVLVWIYGNTHVYCDDSHNTKKIIIACAAIGSMGIGYMIYKNRTSTDLPDKSHNNDISSTLNHKVPYSGVAVNLHNEIHNKGIASILNNKVNDKGIVSVYNNNVNNINNHYTRNDLTKRTYIMVNEDTLPANTAGKVLTRKQTIDRLFIQRHLRDLEIAD